jgi:hypothetical protein
MALEDPYHTKPQLKKKKNGVLPVICFTKIGQYTLAMFVAEIE